MSAETPAEVLVPTPTPSAPTKQEGSQRALFEWSWPFAFWLSAVGAGLVVAIVWRILVKDIEGGSTYTLWLLLVSPILLIMGFPIVAKPPVWLTAIYVTLEGWKNFLLVVYAKSDEWPGISEAMSFVAIVGACIALVVILRVAQLTIQRRAAHSAIRQHFFVTICGALYLFAHVTYDLTFALALHDRGGLMGGLYSVPKLVKAQPYTFTFPSGGADIDTISKLSDEIKEDWPSSTDDQITLVKEYYPGQADEIYRETASNVDEWKRLERQIDVDKPSWWRVNITGHASDDLAGDDGVRKNLHLSEMRVEDVRKAIQYQVKKRRADARIEWLLRAISNDDNFVGNNRFPVGKNHKLSVEILLERERRFELLDYAYFMVYTITTTGYGDLMPTSPRAKFITCLANMFELLFMVVLLNLAFGVWSRDPAVDAQTDTKTTGAALESS